MSDGLNECLRKLETGQVNINQDVTKQNHYTQFKIQPLQFIAENNLDFFQGNIIKYVCRYKMKDGIKDLHKAKHYMEKLLEKELNGVIKL